MAMEYLVKSDGIERQYNLPHNSKDMQSIQYFIEGGEYLPEILVDEEWVPFYEYSILHGVRPWELPKLMDIVENFSIRFF